MVKLLFLDIDGCLNWSPYADSLYFMSTYELKQHYHDLTYLKDKIPVVNDNLAALKHIVDSIPDLKVIWTTDRRFDIGDDHACKYGWHNPKIWLETLPWLNDRIISMTPKKLSSTRPEEILLWFHDNANDKKLDITNYAIIDDYDSHGMLKFGKHFFKCDPNRGLTMNQADEIIAYLKTDDFNKEELDFLKEK